jgi:hypothetical protein
MVGRATNYIPSMDGRQRLQRKVAEGFIALRKIPPDSIFKS